MRLRPCVTINSHTPLPSIPPLQVMGISRFTPALLAANLDQVLPRGWKGERFVGWKGGAQHSPAQAEFGAGGWVGGGSGNVPPKAAWLALFWSEVSLLDVATIEGLGQWPLVPITTGELVSCSMLQQVTGREGTTLALGDAPCLFACFILLFACLLALSFGLWMCSCVLSRRKGAVVVAVLFACLCLCCTRCEVDDVGRCREWMTRPTIGHALYHFLAEIFINHLCRNWACTALVYRNNAFDAC